MVGSVKKKKKKKKILDINFRDFRSQLGNMVYMKKLK